VYSKTVYILLSITIAAFKVLPVVTDGKTLGKIGKHRTRDFKLQNKMDRQSQKVWILEDFALNQSQYVRYD
jgi:hypothetical protein